MNTTPTLCHDDLTGLGDQPDLAVAPVRVAVLDHGMNPTADSADLEALRHSINQVQERLHAMDDLQRQCEALRAERDQLLQELAEARCQLAEVAALQRQLQRALDPG